MELVYQIQLYKNRIVKCPMCGCVLNRYVHRVGSSGKYRMFICLDYGHSFSETWLKFHTFGFYRRLMQTVSNTTNRATYKRQIIHWQTSTRKHKG